MKYILEISTHIERRDREVTNLEGSLDTLRKPIEKAIADYKTAHPGKVDALLATPTGYIVRSWIGA